MRFLAVSGSLRAASTNTALLRAIAANAPSGQIIELFERLADIPIYNPNFAAFVDSLPKAEPRSFTLR